MQNNDQPCSLPCHKCIREFKIVDKDMPMLPLDLVRMILCPKCGNKRCPHASDHRLECTGSNEPGQEGSVYA